MIYNNCKYNFCESRNQCMFTSDQLISPQNVTFEVKTCQFYHEQIPKASKIKTVPLRMWESDVLEYKTRYYILQNYITSLTSHWSVQIFQF